MTKRRVVFSYEEVFDVLVHEYPERFKNAGVWDWYSEAIRLTEDGVVIRFKEHK